jgi:hypothetical protein
MDALGECLKASRFDSIIDVIRERLGGLSRAPRWSADDEFRDRLIEAGVEPRIVASASPGELKFIGRRFNVSRPKADDFAER